MTRPNYRADEDESVLNEINPGNGECNLSSGEAVASWIAALACLGTEPFPETKWLSTSVLTPAA